VLKKLKELSKSKPMKTKLYTLPLTIYVTLYAQQTTDEWRRLHAIDLKSYTITYTPDSRIIAAANAKSWSLQLINTRSGDIVKKIDTGHQSGISTVAVIADGAMLATGSYDSCVKLWNLENLDKPLHSLDHSNWIRSLAWHEEKKLLASASDERTILLRDLRQPDHIVDRLEGHTTGVRAVTFQYDGAALISGGADTTIKRWDLRNLKQPQQLIGHQSAVRSLTVMRSLTVNREDILASVAGDGIIQLQDLNQPSELSGTFEHSHTHEFPSLSFDQPDGQLLASAAWKSVYLWDLKNKQLAGQLKFNDYAEAVAFSPDGTQLAICTDNITLWRHPDTVPCQ
jgi:WD40 repeat protein